MSQLARICGIDVSAETIDISFQNLAGKFEHHKLSNKAAGFEILFQKTGADFHFVFEATGVYHLNLMFFLHEKSLPYSVVNPVQIKRYIQMHLERNKTDRKDAKRICEYGIERRPEVSKMPDDQYFECRAINNAIQTITNEITSFSNQIHSLSYLPVGNESAIQCYENIITKMKEEQKKLDKELAAKLKEWQPELVELVSSVVGIGKRASTEIIIHTNGFENIENYRELISFFGLAPIENSSGSSIKGRTKICKQGGGKIRSILYMCAMNAMVNNPVCKDLYDRLVGKGKHKKVALMAVCNKLLKQIFAVVQSKVPFDKNYTKKVA